VQVHRIDARNRDSWIRVSLARAIEARARFRPRRNGKRSVVLNRDRIGASGTHVIDAAHGARRDRPNGLVSIVRCEVPILSGMVAPPRRHEVREWIRNRPILRIVHGPLETRGCATGLSIGSGCKNPTLHRRG